MYHFEEEKMIMRVTVSNICRNIHKFYHRHVFVYFLGGDFSMLIKKNISTKAG